MKSPEGIQQQLSNHLLLSPVEARVVYENIIDSVRNKTGRLFWDYPEKHRLRVSRQVVHHVLLAHCKLYPSVAERQELPQVENGLYKTVAQVSPGDNELTSVEVNHLRKLVDFTVRTAHYFARSFWRAASASNRRRRIQQMLFEHIDELRREDEAHIESPHRELLAYWLNSHGFNVNLNDTVLHVEKWAMQPMYARRGTMYIVGDSALATLLISHLPESKHSFILEARKPIGTIYALSDGTSLLRVA